MPAWENVAVAALTVAALALLTVAARAWWRTRSTKVLLLALAFALFFAKGLAYSWALFSRADWTQAMALPGILLDIVALALLYAAVLARRT